MLRSKSLAREFILAHGIVDEMRSDNWLPLVGVRLHDQRTAVDYFDKYVRTISEDKRSGLVTVSIDWKSPDVAATWANDLVDLANSKLRAQAEEEASTNVRFLREQLSGTAIVALQQSIGRLLESETQKLMLAKGNEQFAFRTIDIATPPIKRIRPQRIAIVVATFLMGGVAAAMAMLARQMMRNPLALRRHNRTAPHDPGVLRD